MLCKCPQLSPLQKRFAASLGALALLALVYWLLSNPHFAYAAELEFDGTGASRIGGEDHNWYRIPDEESEVQEATRSEDGQEEATLTRRAEETNAVGENDAPNNLNIVAGQTSLWRYTKELLDKPQADRGTGLPSVPFLSRDDEDENNELANQDEGADLDKRQTAGSKQVFISMNTCIQPTYNGTGTQSTAPPQLTLYVATGPNNRDPGPDSNGAQEELVLDEGFVNATITASDDIWMAVHAPQLPSDFTGGWNYDLAVSTTDYFHRSNNTDANLYQVDTDTNAALLVTDDLTTAPNGTKEFSGWMNMTAPFTLFANNNNYTKVMGLTRSYCGLQINSQIQASQSDPFGATSHVQTGMITRGTNNNPKEQFYITNLNGSSSYTGYLARPGNSTASGAGVVGGGGEVWASTPWTTKSDGNCQLMFNLSFCSEVAYAVPANPITFPNRDTLAAAYDHQAAEIYTNFTYTMQTVPCQTTNDAKYSLAKTCDDCAAAYKTWLCAVQLPRCEDWSKQDPGGVLQPRNVAAPFINQTYLPPSYLSSPYQDLMPGAPTLDGTPAFSQTMNSTFASNQSRNGLIDAQIMPGPYMELLPCEDLCWGLVRNCPASLGFACPAKGRGLERSYGNRTGNGGGKLSCSYLGAVVFQGAASERIMAPSVVVWAVGIAAFVGLLLG